MHRCMIHIDTPRSANANINHMSITKPASQQDLKNLEKRMDKRFGEMDKRFGEMDKRFGEMDKRFGEMDKRFDSLDGKFFEWKSEIHDLIDAGFTSRARVLDDEVGVLNTRTTDLRERVTKLETAVFKH
jgi:hypothetical protein